MTIVNSLISNPDIILFAIITIILVIYAIKRGKKGLYSAALYLVTVAEEEWGSNTGKIKFAQVISTIKKTFPIISLFIREEELKKIIEDALDEMKSILTVKQSKESKELTTEPAEADTVNK